MNIYFLVEGKRSERKVYPKWLSYLLPEYKRVDTPEEAEHNSFYLVSGEGYPSIMHHFQNAIIDVNKVGKYDYLVVCIDVEETSIEERKALFYSKAHLLHGCKLKVITQNPCFESWMLGNRTIFKRNPQSAELKRYIEHYDVSLLDTELMPAIDPERTKAQFHASYLQNIFQERGISYTKHSPGEVAEPYYLNELEKRAVETGHIATFQDFCTFCRKIRS